jgi:hypothetical protein
MGIESAPKRKRNGWQPKYMESSGSPRYWIVNGSQKMLFSGMAFSAFYAGRNPSSLLLILFHLNSVEKCPFNPFCEARTLLHQTARSRKG